jgi:hypothetical protein
MDARSDARDQAALMLDYSTPPSAAASRPPGPSSHDPQVIRILRPADLVHREPARPVVAPPPVEVARQAPARPAYLPVDVDRLDNELWKRFEKRVRVENDRRGRG